MVGVVPVDDVIVSGVGVGDDHKFERAVADSSVLAEDELADTGNIAWQRSHARHRRGPLLFACLRLPLDHDNVAKLTTPRDRIVSGHG